MLGWKSHVRSRLQLRDETEKVPFTGVFTCLRETQERLEFRDQILEEIHCKSLEKVGVEDGRQTKLLHLQLRESEHLAEKLSQTVSDLTAVLYLKEAEIQYWQSRVTHYHKEALRLAKGSNSLKSALSEYEFTVECQSKELASLHKEQERLKEALAQVQRENDQLLQCWMDRKCEEALRVNEYNNTQERPMFVGCHTLTCFDGLSAVIIRRVCKSADKTQLMVTADQQSKHVKVAAGAQTYQEAQGNEQAICP